jgi:ATP-dependent RNA helicase DeaD
MTTETVIQFTDLGLNDKILATLKEIGYEKPSPIQEKSIPILLKGGDMIGAAQTGTGKTAAFALPILNNIKIEQKNPQVLVLAPTRELAIQVAEAFQTFSRNIKGLHVLPIYGGTEYGGQLRGLKRGVHIVVGTPGRVMDHIKKKSLNLSDLSTLILDEADEMLKMGFIDDVEWILSHAPEKRQIILFSATMPKQIKNIAQKYLTNPSEVIIKQKATTASTIEQKYWLVSGVRKLDALTRMLESETFDGIIIFVRTKNSTVELAEKLEARGYAAAALNGDIAQNNRERLIEQLKKKKIDILVATDVAARGLDVQRVSHVINYDIPTDTESYVHRIGRTGRAGRTGTAILFVAPRERRLLSTIERVNKTTIKEMHLPSTQDINDNRVNKFKEKIIDAAQSGGIEFYQQMIESIENDNNIPSVEIAAALAKLLQGDEPFFLKDMPIRKNKERGSRDGGRDGGRDRGRERGSRDGARDRGRDGGRDRNRNTNSQSGLIRYRLNVGTEHGVKVGNIIGAIANEAGIDSADIQKLSIENNESFVSLPKDMSSSALKKIQNAWVSGQQLSAQKIGGSGKPSGRSGGGKPHRGKGKPRGDDKGKKRSYSKKPKE